MPAVRAPTRRGGRSAAPTAAAAAARRAVLCCCCCCASTCSRVSKLCRPLARALDLVDVSAFTPAAAAAAAELSACGRRSPLRGARLLHTQPERLACSLWRAQGARRGAPGMPGTLSATLRSAPNSSSPRGSPVRHLHVGVGESQRTVLEACARTRPVSVVTRGDARGRGREGGARPG